MTQQRRTTPPHDSRSAEGRTRRSNGRGSSSSRRPTVEIEPLASGQKLRDVRVNRVGTVLDFACQYSHPKAQPVYSYLVKWDDGQIQAISEGILGPGAIEPIA